MFKNIVDMHTHSINSCDGNCSVDDLCRSAVERGVKTIAFTDHVEIDTFFEGGYDKAAHGSVNDILKAKEKFKNELDICVGTELGEPTYNLELAEEFINKYDFDIIMCSVHNLWNKQDFCFLDYSGSSADKLLKEYFYELKLVADWGKFDSLSHLTYPLRYMVGEQKIKVDLTKYASDIDEILSLLIKNEKALEINTSGLRQLIGSTMPGEDVVRRFKQLGGKFVTVGSDAHYTEHIGAGINEGMEIAKRCGFDCVTIYKKHQPVEIPIE